MHILDHFIEDISNPIKRFRCFTWPDHPLLDCSWSDTEESILWSCSSDGRIQVWDLNSYLPIEDPLSDFEPSPHPVKIMKGHSREIHSIEWNRSPSSPDHVLTASCDKTFNVWDAKTSCLLSSLSLPSDVNSFIDVSSVVSWSKHIPSTFASASTDGYLRIWCHADSPDKPVMEINSCSNHLLSVDCSPHDSNSILISSSSGHISQWDMRSPSVPVTVISGHKKPVKKVKFHPHKRSTFASVSCDFTTKIWDLHRDQEHDALGPLVNSFKHHSDHVNGFDFNSSIVDQVVDCGSDSLVCLYSISGGSQRSSLTRSTSC